MKSVSYTLKDSLIDFILVRLGVIMTPVRLEALLEGNSAEIPANTSLKCSTPVDLQSHSCVQGKGSFIIFTDTFHYTANMLSSSVKFLHQAGEFFLIYGKKLKPVVLDACYSLQKISKKASDPHYTRYPSAEEVVDCIQKHSMEGNDVRSRVRDSDSKGTTTALPTEISEFYNTTIRPFIESQTEFSTTIGSPYANFNTTSETPLGISGKTLESSNSTIYTTVGGAAAGVLISGIAAIAWTWKRKTLNEKRRERYQEMVTSNGRQLVKSSGNNSLIPQNSIV
ncbi:MAG: hypothetical protein AB2993_04795 [Candidatus Symbiodolus clandestinus]